MCPTPGQLRFCNFGIGIPTEAYLLLASVVMGLATPAWGCSCELGSEVCYPAREATISSLLEACLALLPNSNRKGPLRVKNAKG